MDTHVLVPVKRLDDAKSRLADVLSPEDRATLMSELLDHVLAVTQAAGVGPVTVVSAEALSLNGVPRFDDGGAPWNNALAAAMAAVVDESTVAVIAGDLPLLVPDDVRALVAAIPDRGLAIARARDGGTNAVAMRPPGIVSTHFGAASSAGVHAAAARAAGVDAVLVDLPGFAFDVDTPEDLAAWRQN